MRDAVRLRHVDLHLTPASSGHVRGDCLKAVHGSLMINLPEDLRQRLHGPGVTIKPFTVATLKTCDKTGRFERDVSVGTEFVWRISGLSSELSAAIHDLRNRESVEIDRHLFHVIGEKDDLESGRPRATSYIDLLTDARTDSTIQLRFTSPTAFKAGDVFVPFPLADSVFGGYFDTWQRLGNVDLAFASGEFRQFCRERISIEAFRLTMERAWYDDPPQKGRGRRPIRFEGFVGQCTFRIKSRDNRILKVFNALADFAAFCGTGAKRAQGAGQTQRIEVRRRHS